MTKKLIIIRHAKSTWAYGSISDMDRPLKEIGIDNTILVSQKIRERKIAPDLIASSPAVRAYSTAMIVARELRYPFENIKIDSTIYGDSLDDILEIIRATDNRVGNLFIFGHNQVFTDLPNRFLKEQIDNLPTSGAVILEFDTENWVDISKRNVISEACIFPKHLDNE